VTGNVVAATNQNCIVTAIGSRTTVTIVGNISNSATGNHHGLLIQGGCTGIVTGNVSHSGTGVGGAITTVFNSQVSVTGTISCTSTSAAVVVANGSRMIATGPFICSAAGNMPFLTNSQSGFAGEVRLSPIANNEFRFAHATSGTTSFFSADAVGGNPAPSNVRFGTVYGIDSEP
jgi:hypothetical protein